MDLQIFKGRWGEKKRGKNQVFKTTLPKLAFCVCACVCLHVDMYVYVCVFLKIFTFCFLRPTLFLEMALNTKKHEKCLFSLSASSFIHFPASRGAFSSPEQAPSPLPLPNWTEGGWEWKEEPMGCFRWGGDAAVFTTAAGKCVSFV